MVKKHEQPTHKMNHFNHNVMYMYETVSLQMLASEYDNTVRRTRNIVLCRWQNKKNYNNVFHSCVSQSPDRKRQ